MQTQHENTQVEPSQATNVGRAVVAWLVAAILAVTFAAIVSFEAQAAPYGMPAMKTHIEHGSALALFAVAGIAVFTVTALMWRDFARQTQRSIRARGRF